MMASAANKAVVSGDSRDFGYLIALTPTKTCSVTLQTC